MPLWKPTGTKTHTASLLAKPTPLNANLGSDRFPMFNKKRDIPAARAVRAYEIKRGNGQFDAGKIRSIRRDLKCIQVLLKGYGGGDPAGLARSFEDELMTHSPVNPQCHGATPFAVELRSAARQSALPPSRQMSNPSGRAAESL